MLHPPVKVALKTLRRWSGDDVYRLKREFRNLADVAHPNLVSLYDLVIDDEACFFTMELVEGTTLVDYVRQESSPAGRSARAPVVPIRRSERRAGRGQRSAAELSIRIAEVTV